MSDTSSVQVVEPPVEVSYPGNQPEPETTPPDETPQPGLDETPEPDGAVESEDSQEQPELETVTITKDGRDYVIPKDLEPEILFQRDYTQKTQDLAEQRRALETEAENQKARFKAQQDHLGEVAQLHNLEQYLAQLNGQLLAAQNGQVQMEPDQFQQAMNALTLYGRQRDELAQRIEQRMGEARKETEQSVLTKRNEALDFARREIPNWTDESERTLTTFAERQGVPEKLVQQATLACPATLKVLHLAHIGQQFLDSQLAATTKKSAKPVSIKKVGKGGAPTPTGPTDDMSAADWMAARNRQLAARRQGKIR